MVLFIVIYSSSFITINAYGSVNGIINTQTNEMNYNLVCTFSILLTIILFGIYILNSRNKEQPKIQPLEESFQGYLTPCYMNQKPMSENANIVSTILMWANQGYIELVDSEQPLLRKIKDLDTTKSVYEKNLFVKIFRNNVDIKITNLSKYNFYENITFLQSNYYKDYQEHTNRRFHILCGFLMLILSLPIALCLFIGISTIETSIQSIRTTIFFIFVITYLIFSPWLFYKDTERFNSKKLLLSIISICFCIVIFLTLKRYLIPTIYIILIILSFLINNIILLSIHHVSKKERKMKDELEQIKAFIRYFETYKIKDKILHDPSLYFELLPYAYSLGIYDLCIYKFQSILIPCPWWLKSTNYDWSDSLQHLTQSLAQNINVKKNENS